MSASQIKFLSETPFAKAIACSLATTNPNKLLIDTGGTKLKIETHKTVYIFDATPELLDDVRSKTNTWAEGDETVCMTIENAMEHEALRPLLKDIGCDGDVILSL